MDDTERAKPSAGLPEIVARLEALIGQEHVSQEYVRFRIDLLKAQWSVRAAQAATSAKPATPPARKPRGDDGQPARPALDPTAVGFDPKLVRSLFDAICAAVEARGGQSEEVGRLRAAAEKEPALLEEIARKTAFGPDQDYVGSLSRRLEVSADALLFFGRTLAAPFVAEAARHLGQPSDSAADTVGESGWCGVCGSPPGFARLRQDDGKRILCCSLCGESWLFKRLECPYCANRDDEGLRFLRVTADDPRWIETCETCKRYIKTVDERKLPAGPQIIPLVEETATLHLDLLAEKEGYARKLPYTALG